MTYQPVYGPCFKVVITKAMPYRAEALEEFAHVYTFSPVNLPQTQTEWEAIAGAIRAQEQLIYVSDTKWHRALGYDNNDPHAAHVWSVDWEALGQVVSGSFVPTPTDSKGAGDQASCVQWLHSVRSAKGKPVYFRKFHHEPYMAAGGGDSLSSDYKNVLQTYANYMRTYLGGPYSTKYPTGTSLTADVLPYVTTRTLKHRGKRPRPPA